MNDKRLRHVEVLGPRGVTVIPGSCDPTVTMHPSGSAIVLWLEEDGTEHRLIGPSCEMVYEPAPLIQPAGAMPDLRKS